MTFKATYQPNLPNTFLASRASPVNAYSYTLRKLGEERSVILPTASPRSLLPLPEPLPLSRDSTGHELFIPKLKLPGPGAVSASAGLGFARAAYGGPWGTLANPSPRATLTPIQQPYTPFRTESQRMYAAPSFSPRVYNHHTLRHGFDPI